MAVAPWIVSDELWGLIEPLLPVKERRFRYPEIHEAFLALGCRLICYRRLRSVSL